LQKNRENRLIETQLVSVKKTLETKNFEAAHAKTESFLIQVLNNDLPIQDSFDAKSVMRVFHKTTERSEMTVSADLALINGKVLTMNPSQPCADAVAIKGDRIIQVGANEEVSKLIGEKTRVIRLKGKTVVPGLIDTHIHVSDFGRVLTWINLENIESITDMQECLSKRVEETPKGKWILGSGWDQSRFAEKRLPTRFDLDTVSPGNPVVFYHKSGKICVVNSKALELAGVTQQATAVSGSGIERNEETGEFTGILRDDAMNLVWRVVPEPSEEELMDAAGLACRKIAEAGLTSIHWIVLSPVEISIIRKLHAQHRLSLRVYVIIPANLLNGLLSSEMRDDSADALLKFGGVVIFADGYLAARTAALFQPYSDANTPDTSLLCTQEKLNTLVAKIHNANFQLVIHAVGDKAVDAALTSIKASSPGAAGKSLRNRIEQAAVLNEALIARIKKQQAIVSVQPNVINSEFSVWSATDRLGTERAQRLFPLKTLFKEGIRVVGGSDCPMEPLSPLSGIQAAVTREFFPEERITVDEALRMYTVNAACASFEEELKGSIEPGKLADLTVLSNDPRAVPLSEIENIGVELTLVGGRVVYQKLPI
jgi:predicted amidohydrolase YtcJ